MTRYVILDAWTQNDAALENSHWVACRTADALGNGVTHHEGERVDRSLFEEVCATQACEGVVFLGHGNADRLLGVGIAHDVPVVDLGNLDRIGARWCHAFACLSGRTLAMTASREGVGLYVGYNERVVVEFVVENLPGKLRELLIADVTVTTCQLVAGERSRPRIMDAARTAGEALRTWLGNNPDWCAQHPSWLAVMGLRTLAARHLTLEIDGTWVTD